MTDTPPTRMRSPAARCAHPACGRFVPRGETFCLRHRAPDDAATSDADAGAAIDAMPPFPPSDYRVLLDNDLRATLADATNEILERGLIDELGSLRVVLLRLLLEERDLAKLITGITRITTVAAQAMRVQYQVSGAAGTETMETISDLVQSVVKGLDGERTQEAA